MYTLEQWKLKLKQHFNDRNSLYVETADPIELMLVDEFNEFIDMNIDDFFGVSKALDALFTKLSLKIVDLFASYFYHNQQGLIVNQYKVKSNLLSKVESYCLILDSYEDIINNR